MNIVGIDNGVTGGMCIVEKETKKILYISDIPVKKVLDYTKKKQYITRLDFSFFLTTLLKNQVKFALLERPLVNPKRFVATKSALRCLESELVALEYLGVGYKFVDSKEWQKKFLPKGLKAEELKKASVDIASRETGMKLSTGQADAYFIAKLALEIF